MEKYKRMENLMIKNLHIMKNLKYLEFIFIFSLLLLGCNEDESIQLVEPNHRVIVTSEMNFENTINIGEHIDFGDLSRGVENRLWTFPADAAVIGGETGNTSNKDVVKGTFTKSGVFDVLLNQTFKGNVYPNEDSTEPLQTRELDTTIVVTVIGAVEASFQMNYINEDGSTGAPLSLSDNAENEIVASKFVRITQNSAGSPTNFRWLLPGAKTEFLEVVDEPDAESDVRYTKLGTWDLQFIAARTRPTDSDTIYIKNFIKVIPSTEPVTLDRVYEYETQTKIGLEFSREIDPATVATEDFSVAIETNTGTTIIPEISNVSVDPDEGNVVIIEIINEIMYNDDIVKVSYTPGALTTLDLVASEAITDAILTDFIKTNLLPDSDVDYSFETVIEDNWRYLGWGGRWEEYARSISFDRAHTGDKSMLIELSPQGGMIIGNVNVDGDGAVVDNINFTAEKGFNYEMGAWFYVESLSTLTAEANIRMYWRPGTNWGIGDNIAFTNDTPIGQWFYSSEIATFSADGEVSYMIRGLNDNTDSVRFYMDDLTLFKLTSRP